MSIKTFFTFGAMNKKMCVFTLCLVTICVMIEFWGIKNKLLENVSNNSLKNINTFYESMSEAMDNWTKELNNKTEEIWNDYTNPENQYQERHSALTSLNTNSEDKNNFFVVTAIYNPASYKSRHKLYQNFVRHMNNTGAQLVTIECIFPSLNQTEFQMTDANNPFHIQLKSESVYWMKENLINIAVSRLPPHAKWVCWLDADIQFENPNWVELAIQEMQKYTVIQMFETAHFLGPAPENEILRTDYSFGYSIAHNKTIDPKNYKNWYPHPGYGWAMAVEDFLAINGLPYYSIAGSGDYLFAYSLINGKSIDLGRYKNKMHPEYVKMIVDNMKLTFSKLVDLTQSDRNIKKEIAGYLPDSIRHYWHGSKKNRQYLKRWKILADHKFTVQNDTTVTEDGLLLFNPEKPDLQKCFVEYFGMRLEDFNETHLWDT